MVDMVPPQYFHLRKCTCSAVQRSPENIIFTSCGRRSCANRFLVGLADVSQSCQQNLPYFCCVRSALTHQLYTVVKLIVSTISNLGLACPPLIQICVILPTQQTSNKILTSYRKSVQEHDYGLVCAPETYSSIETKLEKELTPRGVWQ